MQETTGLTGLRIAWRTVCLARAASFSIHDPRLKARPRPPVAGLRCGTIHDPRLNVLIVLPNVFPHLMMPVGPVMATLRTPVIKMMGNAAAF